MAFSILLIVVLIAIGTLMLYGTIKTRLKVNSARDWPVVRGIVTKSDVLEDYTRTATGTVNPTFSPGITYDYTVSGRKLTNNRVIFGKTNFPFVVTNEVLEHYPVDTEVDVYYNPADTADSVLLPKSRQGLRSIIPGAFLIFAGVSIAVILIIF